MGWFSLSIYGILQVITRGNLQLTGKNIELKL